MIRRVNKFLVGVFILGVLSIPVVASPLAGKQADACKSSDPLMQGLCIGYMQGLFDATYGTKITMDDGSVVQIVYAENVDVKQIIHVFVKYVTDNPNIENKLAAVVYVDCLVKAKLMGLKPISAKPTDQ